MVLLLLQVLAALLHAALVLAAAPLLAGLLAKFRARLRGRRGAPLLQPYHELRKLLAKQVVVPETATALYPVWPYVAVAASGAAAVLTPGFCLGMFGAGGSDFITLIGLLALARAALLLAGLETGFAFGGAGAARDVLFSLLAEAALLLVVLNFVLLAHAPTLDGVARHFQAAPPGFSVTLGFALAALAMVAVVEVMRLPGGGTGGGGGQAELGMAQEALLLEYSGRDLLLLRYAAMLRLMVWLGLVGTLLWPFGMAQAGALLSWPLGLALWVVKLGLLVGVLAIYEVSVARLAVFRVPEVLGGAMLLGLLAVLFLLVAGRFGA